MPLHIMLRRGHEPCSGPMACRTVRVLRAPRTQVIAISHHREFHELADHIVRLHAADGRTVATDDR